MERSLNIIIVTIVMGVLFISPVIHAQSDRDITNNLITEPSSTCELISRAAYSFIVELRGEISSVIEKVRSKIAGNGGKFEGDSKCGCFQGRSLLGLIKGKYRSISDTQVEVTIEDKPFLVPYSIIESNIKAYLS